MKALQPYKNVIRQFNTDALHYMRVKCLILTFVIKTKQTGWTDAKSQVIFS